MTFSRIPADTIREAYARLGSIDAVADEVGITRTSVHERLKRLGIDCDGNGKVWTEADNAIIVRDFVAHRDTGQLKKLAESMGRTVPFLSRKARALGLTDRNAPSYWNRTWKGMTENHARLLMDEFKAARGTLREWCDRKGIDDGGFGRTMREFWPDEWEHVIESKVPRSTMYSLGRGFEYRTRDHLKKLGYFVMRSPASRSPVDLVAVRKGAVLFVQCKRGGALPVVEWNEVYDLALSVGALPILAATPKGRGIDYHVLIARKDGTKRRQPMAAFDPAVPEFGA